METSQSIGNPVHTFDERHNSTPNAFESSSDLYLPRTYENPRSRYKRDSKPKDKKPTPSSFSSPEISFDLVPGIMNVLVLLLAASSVTWVPLMVLGGKNKIKSEKNKNKSVKINKKILYE
jgi:hypothetical protein